MTAVNGRVALDVVQRERPDVVLMDVNMPEMSGFEACRELRQEPATRLLPIILITALSATEDRIRGIDAGADDFLTKPFAIDELRARVRSLMRLKRYTDDLDSAESVILSLALTIEARDPVYRRATASASRGTPSRSAGTCISRKISGSRCIEAGSCTTSGRSGSPTRCC